MEPLYYDILIHPRYCRKMGVSSEDTGQNYNCFAWTIDVTDRPVFEDEIDELYGNGNRIFELIDFQMMYQTLGKHGIVYGFSQTNLQHAAKPLGGDCASSKCGTTGRRVRHDKFEMEDGWYGDIQAEY